MVSWEVLSANFNMVIIRETTCVKSTMVVREMSANFNMVIIRETKCVKSTVVVREALSANYNKPGEVNLSANSKM